MTSWTKELDEAAVLATKSGYWHTLLFYLLCGLAAIPTSFLVFSQVFTNASPDHWCAPPKELELLNLSDDLLKNLTIPIENGKYENCKSYHLSPKSLFDALNEYVEERTEYIHEAGSISEVKVRQLLPVAGEKERKEQLSKVKEAILSLRGNETEYCRNGWIYSKGQYQDTLVTEFSLVCDNDWLPRTGNALFWVGSIFGNLFFGWMSDRYGRRPCILLMITLQVPLTIAASFPSTYWGYVALRVAGGLFFPALYQLPFILALELMPPKQRTYTGIVVGMLFASGMCLLALLAFAIRDWFYFSLATSMPFLLLFGFFWLIPESPRWLVGRGRIAEAEKVLINLARKNGINLSRGFLLDIHKKIKSQEDSEAEITMLSNVNGHIPSSNELLHIECTDRNMDNMVSFKPKNKQIIDNTNNEDNFEKITTPEDIDITSNKTTLKNERDSFKERDIKERERIDVESQSHNSPTLKLTQSDTADKLSRNSIRKASLQFVNKFLNKDGTNFNKTVFDAENSEGDSKVSPMDIFRYPNMRKKFILLTFDWVALGVVYNSLSYDSPNLGVNDYLAFFIGGAVELPSYFIAWRFMDRFGRRCVLCVFMSIGGIACLSCLLVPDSLPWVTVCLAMLGRLCAAASFSVFYVLIGELLPTVVRAQAMGAASFITGLGLLACPYIVDLAKYSRALPLVIMGVLSFMGGVMSLFLPETLNQPLPQTLGDGELFGRDFKILSCVQKPNEK